MADDAAAALEALSITDAQAQLAALQAQVSSLEASIAAKGASAAPAPPFAYSASNMPGRVMVADVLERADGGKGLAGTELVVGGWVRTGREQGKGAFAFLEIVDGSCSRSLQVMVDKDVHDLKQLVPTGTSVAVRGMLVEAPEDKRAKQPVELKAVEILYVGLCDPKTYPLAKKRHTMEHLRTIAHLRPRTNTLSAVFRVRNSLAFATHKFYNERRFLYVHTPLITASDCEGAGEMFQVTTLLPPPDKALPADVLGPDPAAFAAAKLNVDTQADALRALKAQDPKPDKRVVKDAAKLLNKAKGELELLSKVPPTVGGVPITPDRVVDYKEDFFGAPSFLTVSGQLNGEIAACGMSNVYTFGPTFRAEDSHTSRHLAEFWMIEPEVAFCDLNDDMQLAEDYVRYMCQYLLDNNYADLEFFAAQVDKDALERVKAVAATPFKRLSYTDAITVLEKEIESGVKFEEKVFWGVDLASEHERHLTENVYKQPVIVYNYPKEIKAFYMRLNDDNKTVAAMDCLVPKVGELIGGSQREERLDVLEARLIEVGQDPKDYWWYADLRRYGSVPHAGFGLGFERMVLFTTGMENIRDVIPFPRFPGHAAF